MSVPDHGSAAALRLLVLSDLHVELAPYAPITEGFDLVVLAGDIHNGAAALHWARQAFPAHPIVQIAGNHEFWGDTHARALDTLRDTARRLDITFLENEGASLLGARFFGCTLWTDFRVFEVPGRPLSMRVDEAMRAVVPLVRDYRELRWSDGQGERAFVPADAAALHAASRHALSAELARACPLPRVVVTHFLPSWRSVSPDFEHSVTNAAFVSDLDALIAQADLWIHGHTHSSHRWSAGRCTVACNPRGYPRPRRGPGVFENPSFAPDRILRLPLQPSLQADRAG